MIKIVQITDSHLGANDGDTILSMNADDSLCDVLSLIKEQHDNIDLVLATGDIANDALPSAYQRFYSTVKEYLPVPMSWLAGNHDKSEYMTMVADAQDCRIIEMGEWVIVLLDSHVVGQIHGNLSDEALAFLPETLTKYADKHILLTFHHQPVPIGSRWMDRYILQNSHDFWKAIKPFSNIKAILWGHVHQEFDEMHNNIRLLSSPSTCIQFAPGKDEFALDRTMPGYRVLGLHADGTLETQVERVADKDYGIDFNSSGY